MASLYLSYKNQDSELAHALAKELDALGHTTIYDALALSPGQNWRDVLLQALTRHRGRIPGAGPRATPPRYGTC